MSGVECAGLIIGVIPLIIECVKVYPTASKVARGIFRADVFDDQVREYVSELSVLLLEFKAQMEQIFDYLPDLSNTRKADLIETFNEKDWNPGSDVAKAFLAMFPDPDTFYWFENVVTQIVRQMGQLVRDTQVFAQKSTSVSSAMIVPYPLVRS
jgi:hypothetical protein